MSVLEILATSDLTTTVHAAAAIIPQTGIIDTANDQTNQLGVLVKNIGGVIVTVGLLVAAFKSKFGIAAIVGALFLGALILFGLNGGLEWLQSQFTGQLQSSAVVDAPAQNWSA